MNWTVKSEKNNRIYNLKISVKKNNNELQVKIIVPKENPWGVQPVGWHEREIREMLIKKGYEIDQCLKSTYVTNELANTKVFVYTVKVKLTPAYKRPSTRKPRGTSKSSTNKTKNS